MRTGYTGLDDTAHKINRIYVGVNNIARRCVRGYVGVNGVARLVYPIDQEIPTVSGHYTYDRDVHEAIISEYDEDMVEVSGVTRTTNAGTYVITFTLKSEYYRWVDGTNTPKTASWVIDKKTVTIPSVITNTYTYNGAIQTVATTQYDPYGVTVSGNSAKDAGSYTVTFSLTNTNNYQWTDGTITPKTGAWAINPIYLAIPTVKGSYTYNGKAQSAVISGFNSTTMKKSGTESATVVNTYYVYFDLKDKTNYRWTGGSTAQQKKSWSIAQAGLNAPAVTDTSKTYSAKEQSPTIAKYDNTLIKQGGTASATVAGSYSITFSLVDTKNYKWNSGAITSVSWAIAKATVNAPAVTDTSKTYSAKEQGPTIASYNTSIIKQGGTAKATVVGSYKVTFSLIDTVNYKWNSGAVTSVDWAIAKAGVNAPAVSDTTKTYSGSEQGPTIANYNANIIKQGGTAKATVVGSYKVTFSLIDTVNYKWNSGAVTSVDWAINKKALTIPTVTGNPTYNGQKQGPTLANFDSKTMKKGGVYEATVVSSTNYTIKFNLLDSTNYCWNDTKKTVAEKSATWNILKKPVTVPTLTNTEWTYNCKVQKPTINNNSSYVKVAGTTEATNAGDYTIKFNLADATNCEWAGGGKTEKSGTWKIKKATVRLNAPSKVTITCKYADSDEYYNYYEGTATFKVSCVFADSGSAVTAATLRYSAHEDTYPHPNVTGFSVSNGQATITVAGDYNDGSSVFHPYGEGTVTVEATGSGNYNAVSVDVTIDVK